MQKKNSSQFKLAKIFARRQQKERRFTSHPSLRPRKNIIFRNPTLLALRMPAVSKEPSFAEARGRKKKKKKNDEKRRGRVEKTEIARIMRIK